MKAVALFGVGDIRVVEKEIPKIGDKEVLIKVGACGICGTDIHFFKGEWEVKTPLVLGHEFSGVVEKVGSKVSNIKVGDRVVAEPNIPCGECKYCRMSERNFFCENLQATGVTIDGAFAEYVKVPAQNVYKIPDSLTLEEAALIEPLACIVRGLDNVGIKVGSNVAIVGAGPIGLLMTQVVNYYGASRTFVIDMDDDRLKLAKELGATYTINFKEQDPKSFVYEKTEGIGVDVSIECVGSSAAIETAFRLARRGGKLLIFGVAPEHDVWHVKPFELYDKEISIFTSYRSPYTFQRAVEVASSGKIKLKPIISHIYSLDEAPKAFNELASRKKGMIKVLLKP
ncbi:zinc-dependent alcohol dehydrogenase family protein [archaeon]|jgi:2-desacetyl-2-hydroxyethyl bacteriochlorophyllide A dehydrogenase|nr:zinc-dependent alcohol dehydrogenase family protein [archaeon]